MILLKLVTVCLSISLSKPYRTIARYALPLMQRLLWTVNTESLAKEEKCLARTQTGGLTFGNNKPPHLHGALAQSLMESL
ncbi:hypothetical protein RB195_000824 [Necator americanus]|uniref:Secreted protein n=1 Tax=Necator americanus TaxID=51031 RepID=A0ABR1DBI5_NECAM